MTTIEHDEQGRPCLAITMPLVPASNHDSLALDAALARLCNAPDGSEEARAAAAEIRAISERGNAALG